MTRQNAQYGGEGVSPLSRLGYKAGDGGEPTPTRRKILAKAYEGTLPSVQSSEYMAQWGDPKSEKRLRRMVDHIAGNARQERRKEEPLELAIQDWERDLAWLRHEYYDDKYDFPWPSTS